jgi:hypothetical protein
MVTSMLPGRANAGRLCRENQAASQLCLRRRPALTLSYKPGGATLPATPG